MGTRSRFEVCTTHGPWGGSQGAEWVYRPPEGCIKQIKISVRHGGVVNSIEFGTCLKTGETVSSVFGGKGGSRTDTICIDYPDEYLKSIAVTTGHQDGSVVVQSISFTTNQNRYGPFGTDRGTGSSGTERGTGPFGFFGREKGTNYFGGLGTERGTNPFGGLGTERGTGAFVGFGTDRGTAPTFNPFGGFGTDRGTVYSNDGKGGVIVGFHGRADEYLDAIGVYVMPESLALGSNSTYEDEVMPESVALGPNSTYEDEVMPEPSSSTSGITMPRDAGPWGAGGGKPWDDGIFSTIKQIRVHEGELNVIYALQFKYLKNDTNTVLSQVHGGTDGVKNIQLVNFDDKDEYLIGISGFYGPVKGCDGMEAITSISFHTNKRIHGPFGDEKGVGYTYYTSPACPGKVAGFHGRSNGFLSAIGVHMEYF